jgi:hypothetical protein
MAGIAKQDNQRPGRFNHWAARIGKDPGLLHGFRSGLEDTNAEWLRKHGVEVAFESMKVRYIQPRTLHTYTNDFPLPNGILVETKGKFEPADRKKHLLIKKQWPELDIRFVFQRPSDKIRKGSPTTYAMWAEKHGFRWATKLIPVEWMQEPGPAKKPAEVLKGKPLEVFDAEE